MSSFHVAQVSSIEGPSGILHEQTIWHSVLPQLGSGWLSLFSSTGACLCVVPGKPRWLADSPEPHSHEKPLLLSEGNLKESWIFNFLNVFAQFRYVGGTVPIMIHTWLHTIWITVTTTLDKLCMVYMDTFWRAPVTSHPRSLLVTISLGISHHDYFGDPTILATVN